MSATPPADDSSLLETYLAARDVPCPNCRYNLRGCSGGTCPECGRPLELALQARESGIPHRMFLLLALGWVLLAGSMNSYRFISALYDEYYWASRPYGNLGTLQSQLQGSSGGATPPWGAPLAPTPVSIFSLSALNWSRSIWAGGLVVGALVGLLVLEREWRGAGARPGAIAGRDRRIARLVVFSWVLFGVYASWHIVHFGRELIGLR